MKISRKQIQSARNLVLEHFDDEDIRIREDFHSRRGFTAQFALAGSKSALEEFELYLASTFLTQYIDDEVPAYAVIKAVMDIRELRHEDEIGYDDVVFFYPQFELDD